MSLEGVKRLLEVVQLIDEHRDLDTALDVVESDGRWLISESEMDADFPEDLRDLIVELRETLCEARDESEELDSEFFRKLKQSYGIAMISVYEENPKAASRLYRFESVDRGWCVSF